MMINNRLEIIVEIPNSTISTPTNPNGVTRYNLDTFPPEEQEPMELNFCINDINDISNRNSSSSKTITLPESKNNREVFGFISDLNLQINTFSPNKRSKCIVMLDTIVVLEGWLQLKNIKPNYRTGLTKLECVVYSNQVDFFKSIGEKYLQDLTGFNNETFTHSITNITNSWFSNHNKLDYYYPLIDYGFNYDSNYKENAGGFTGPHVEVSVNQMPPAIYVKSIIDAIFSNATGNSYVFNEATYSTVYQYDSNFFNSNFFSNLIIPFNNGLLTYKGINLFDASFTTPSVTIQSSTTDYSTNSYFIAFDVFNIKGLINSVGTTYSYFGPSTYADLHIDINTLVYNPNAQQSFDFYIAKSDSGGILRDIYHHTWTLPAGATFSINFSDDVKDIFLETGEYLKYNFLNFQTPGRTVYLTNLRVDTQIKSSQIQDIPIQEGDVIRLSKTLPQNIKQKDFLNTIFSMFNLYIDYDPNNTNILRIEPRDDYYYYNATQSNYYLDENNYADSFFKNTNLVRKDWSEKVDIDQVVDIKLLAETQNKTVKLKYKEDKDYYNDNYTGYTNKIYGEKVIEVDNDFNFGEQTISVLFGPTVVANISNSFNFPIANLTKQIDTNSNIPSGRSNANIKIMQRYWDYISLTSSTPNLTFNTFPLNLKSSTDTFKIKSSIGTASYIFNYYPYAGNFNNPYNPSVDLNFDSSLFYYYNNSTSPSNTLYNTFYKNQFDEILDINSKILTAHLYLTPQDIRDFRFSDVIFLRLGSSGQYYHVNKISNYSLTEPQKTVEVELIKIKEICSYPLN